jgi:hypothetical protein
MGQYDAEIYNDLIAGGLNPTAAAGVMGNMSQESSMNPNEAGGGLMQWINGRWTALKQYAASRGLSPNSVAAQVGYFFQELNAGNEGITKQGLNSQSSPAAAALYVSTKFERPDPKQANNAHREAEAQRFYSEFAGGGGASAGTSSGLSFSPTSAGGTPAAITGAAAFPTGSDPIQIIDKSLSLQNLGDPSSWLHPVQSVMQDAGAISLRVVLVLIGLILIIFALVAVVERSGVSAVPVPV